MSLKRTFLCQTQTGKAFNSEDNPLKMAKICIIFSLFRTDQTNIDRTTSFACLLSSHSFLSAHPRPHSSAHPVWSRPVDTSQCCLYVLTAIDVQHAEFFSCSCVHFLLLILLLLLLILLLLLFLYLSQDTKQFYRFE